MCVMDIAIYPRSTSAPVHFICIVCVCTCVIVVAVGPVSTLMDGSRWHDYKARE